MLIEDTGKRLNVLLTKIDASLTIKAFNLSFLALKFNSIIMSEEEKAARIAEQMFSQDAFSQWFGMQIQEVKPGYSRLQMTVRPEMLNGFQIAHGAITYALADSAFAFASNSQGRHAVSIETSIAHLKPLRAGDLIIAEAYEEQLSYRLGRYRIEIRLAGEEKLVALFRGTVYRKEEDWMF